MAVHIIADSASDITQAEAQKMNIHLLPLTVRFGGEEFADGVTIAHDGFYARLAACEALPTTSQVTPWQYKEVLKKMSAGDEAVILTISGGLSGTVQSAHMAAADFAGRAFVVDTRSATVGERVLVEYAVRLREQGMTAAGITAELEARKGSVCLLGVVDTLDSLKRSGRISPAVALAGGLLNIKPVLTMEEGKIIMLGKARGLTQSNNLLNTTVEKLGGINFRLPYAVGWSGSEDTSLRRYLAESADLWKTHTLQVPTCRIGSTIGTHVGPGAVAVAFFTPAE